MGQGSAAEGVDYLILLMPGDEDDFVNMGRQGGICYVGDHGLQADFLRQLIGITHAG